MTMQRIQHCQHKDNSNSRHPVDADRLRQSFKGQTPDKSRFTNRQCHEKEAEHSGTTQRNRSQR
jgi:hypothetical protein